jgi:4-diphosphocytidyl-2-C-methyl-D-erythritol kinase
MISLKAWAKINIGLKILDKRDDGYHNIETTFANVNLADIIQLEEYESGIMIEANGLDLPEQSNLCYRAAELVKKKCACDHGVLIKLTKSIPIGGGLGGGSSDAACVLKGMNRLFGLGLSEEELMKIGGELGADVPFFVKGGAAYARGRGDELKFFKLPKMSLIIYYPGYPISTKWAYEEYDRMLLTPKNEADMIELKQPRKKKKRAMFQIENDFEKVVFKKHPDLLDIKMNVLASGAFLISLSGSGSCLYSVVDERTRKNVVNYFEGIGAEYYEVKTI